LDLIVRVLGKDNVKDEKVTVGGLDID